MDLNYFLVVGLTVIEDNGDTLEDLPLQLTRTDSAGIKI